jgi:WD40 repeat protein
VARIGIQVAEALNHANAQGTLHRDIKPSNLLLDGQGTVWVTDFGLAKAADSADLTHTGDIVGTVRYMAPERFQGISDARSDLYSLGLTLYELLTLRPAFTATDRNRLLEQVRHEEPPRPRKLNPKVPRDLETIVLKTIAKEPAQRYQSAAELAADLQRFVDDKPIRARRTSPAERLWRWCRRNPLLAGMGLVICFVTALGLAGVFWQWRQAEQARGVATARAEAEAEARQTSERTLVDMYTSSGLMAVERNDPAQAMLWFANAARRAGPETERERFKRARALTWRRQALQPVRALEHQAEWVHEMSWHPGGRYLHTQTVLMDLSHGDCTVWDLDREAPFPLPTGVESARSAAWNPDGSRLALGTAKGEVVLCSFPAGEVLHRLPGTGPVRHLTFSPEGRYLAMARDKSARVWDCEQAAFVTEELVHPDQVVTLTFHPKGHLLVTGCNDRMARVFRVAKDTKDPLFRPVRHLGGGPSPIGGKRVPPVFVDEGRGLLAGAGSMVTWYEAETGTWLLPVRPMPVKPEDRSPPIFPSPLAVSPDGKYFAVCDGEKAQIWAVPTRRAVSPVLEHRASQSVDTLSFSPDGRTLVTGSGDRTVRLWSVPDGKPLGKPLVHSSTITQGLFSPDGRFLATAQRGGLTRVWALPVPDTRHRRLPVQGRYSFARLSRDGRYVLPTGLSQRSCDLRATRVFEVATGQPAGPRLESGGIILDGAFSPDGRHAAIVVSLASTWEARQSRPGTHPGQLELWDWRTGKRLFEPLAMPSEPRCLDYSPDGQALAVICAGGQLVLVEPGSGRVERQWQARPPSLNNNYYINNGMVRFSPDGRSVLLFGTEDVVQVWDVATAQPRYAPLQHKGQCHDVHFSPDGRLVSIASWDNTARVWELETGQPVGEPLRHPDWVFMAPFSPDGKYLLTACRDSMARLWDWRAGRQVWAFEHDHEVHAVAFTPDGRWLLTASDDKTLRVWESVTGKPVTSPLELGGFGLTLGVTPAGKHAVVGGFMNELAVFDLGDLEGDSALEPDDLVAAGELLSGQRLHEG